MPSYDLLELSKILSLNRSNNRHQKNHHKGLARIRPSRLIQVFKLFRMLGSAVQVPGRNGQMEKRTNSFRV